MKRYTAAAARARMADMLDEVQRGERVVIERHGTQFELVARRPRKPRRKPSAIADVDPAIDAGQWSWNWTPGRLEFRGGVGRRRRQR